MPVDDYDGFNQNFRENRGDIYSILQKITELLERMNILQNRVDIVEGLANNAQRGAQNVQRDIEELKQKTNLYGVLGFLFCYCLIFYAIQAELSKPVQRSDFLSSIMWLGLIAPPVAFFGGQSAISGLSAFFAQVARNNQQDQNPLAENTPRPI